METTNVNLTQLQAFHENGAEFEGRTMKSSFVTETTGNKEN